MQSVHHRIKKLTVYILIFLITLSASAKTVEEAYALIEKGNPDKAVDILQKIIQKNPKDYAAHLTLGYAHMLKERYAKALESYR
ncbi:MAG TPA: tetratricopeptide repeat protein, partial [Leptospiraceae bacterium]|nr:tetratricopeptide repeat protein [Leptospiraceae bacterium]HNO26608.1 tetratricopeptide repeat protein [Leptospiraceae bacterium]